MYHNPEATAAGRAQPDLCRWVREERRRIGGNGGGGGRGGKRGGERDIEKLRAAGCAKDNSKDHQLSACRETSRMYRSNGL